MSYLANAIDQLLRENNKSAAEVARATKLNPAQMSRWRTGEQKSIKADCLKKLAAGFPTSTKAHARLLFAHLKDENTGPGSKQITIEMDESQKLQDTHAPYQVALPPGVQNDLDAIRSQIASNRQVRDLVHSVANLCRGEKVSTLPR